MVYFVLVLKSVDLGNEGHLLWLLILAILSEVHGEGIVQVAYDLVIQVGKTGLLGGVHGSPLILKYALMNFLFFVGRVLEYFLVTAVFASIDSLQTFWSSESGVEHSLIVRDESHFPSESFIEMILGSTENITFLRVSSRVGLASLAWVI